MLISFFFCIWNVEHQQVNGVSDIDSMPNVNTNIESKHFKDPLCLTKAAGTGGPAEREQRVFAQWSNWTA